MTAPDVWVGPDAEAVAREAYDRVGACVIRALDTQPFVALALAGGGTPRPLYELLRDTRFDWTRIHVGFTDERAVPRDHAQSNFRMIRDTLLAHVPIPAGNVHPLRREARDLEAEARRAAAELEALLGTPPRFDGIVLGMGADGHTASLFPGHPALAESRRSVVAVRHPPTPPDRLTLTLPVLRRAPRAWLLATGLDKSDAIARAVAQDQTLPIVRARAGAPVEYLLDEAAAQRLPG